MNLGDQFLAPDGFANLVAKRRYYFLKTDQASGMTSRAVFFEKKKGRRIQIDRLPTTTFRNGIDCGHIIAASDKMALPPWLSRLEGMDLYAVDLARKKSARPNNQLADQRYGHIEGLLPRLNEILAATNPFIIINAHARTASPQQNRTRLAEWFFAYICHSFQLDALWPEYPNTGTYDKTDEKYNETHFGRASLDNGKKSGWPSAMFAADIVTAVDDMLKSGLTKHAIYIECLKNVWGCRGRLNERSAMEMYQPDGKPFPGTEGKFWYRWYQHLDIGQTNLRLYGERHMRTKAGTKGSYTQDVCALMSKMEVDAYFLKERPRLTHGDESSERLCVARGICVGSKNVVGVGFSLEGEAAYAYQMMLFCAAIGIEAFALLWGLEKEAFLDVFLKGLPPHLISDRGKAPIGAIVGNLKAQFPVRELTETYSGQSKPNVESGHPRNRQKVGPPEYVVSDKDIVQLIQREICRAAKDNHVRNVSSLIVGERAFAETACSPYALAKHLDEQGLNDAITIHFDTAVRTYLIKTDFALCEGGFWLWERSYSCAELDESDTYSSLSPGQSIPVSGYHMPLNLMWIWVEFRGRLYQLQQKLSVRIGERERMITMAELEKESQIKRPLASEQRRSAAAAETEAQARYEKYVGASWGNTYRRPGRPRKSPDAVVEKRVLVSTKARKKAA